MNNNLGSYKALTIISKKLGGPENLMLLLIGSGILIGNLDRIIKKFIKLNNKMKSRTITVVSSYIVHSEFMDYNGAHFKVGDLFRVLEEDSNSILIEIVNDSNNPYFVDKDILLSISNYGDKEQERGFNMHNDSQLVKFIESVSNGNEPVSLSYSDFFPLESIIDYRTIKFKDELTTIDFSDYCKKATKKMIVNINTSKHSSFKETQKILELIRSQLCNKDIEIELGSKPNEDENETTVDIVLYKV